MKQDEITLSNSTNYNLLENSFRHKYQGWHVNQHPFLYQHCCNMNDGMIQEACSEPQSDNLRLTINSHNTINLPKRFRKTSDLTNLKDYKGINLSGLANLNISGSGQFSENGLRLMKQSIGNAVPIIIVDLRQESHGFINGVAISWTDDRNKANKGLTKEEVLSDEITRLQSVLLNEPIYVKDETLIPKKIQNQKKLVQSYGMSNMRIPVTDKEIPNNDTIDYFIKFVNSLRPYTWLHFHCKAGIGRTSTFMVMYDIMKNAKNVSLYDIMYRQVLIGGKNLLRDEQLLILMDRSRSKKRAKLIKTFYRYCFENNDNFKTTWSQWIREHGS